MAKSDESSTIPHPDKVQAAILAILIADREHRIDPDATQRKTEVVLAGAGLNAREISTLTGKSQAAVAKTLQRSR